MLQQSDFLNEISIMNNESNRHEFARLFMRLFMVYVAYN